MAYHAVTGTDKPVLVTGATGRQGGTGRSVAKVLVEGGLSVRALVRTLDERAEALRELGLQIVLMVSATIVVWLLRWTVSNLLISATLLLRELQKPPASLPEQGANKA
jgi:NAD(P)-dependent dehydrogenase (short-subunit alcohol dehydrogenase family)